MTTATPGLLGLLERAAWDIKTPSPTLYRRLAVIMGGLFIAVGILAGLVTSTRAASLDRMTDNGLGVAVAMADFRTNLARADGVAAETLLAGGLEDPLRRSDYQDSLGAAITALGDAALAADAKQKPLIEDLIASTVAYNGLIETARANTRQGFPIGAAYLAQAQTLSADEIGPAADQLRRLAEIRMARAANSANGITTAVPIAGAFVALLGIGLVSFVVAGRSRVMLHPLLLVALAAATALTVVSYTSLSTQASQLRVAATSDQARLGGSADLLSGLADVRIAQIEAVAARGGGGPRYDSALARLDELSVRANAIGNPALVGLLDTYRTSITEIAATDAAGDNRGAAERTINGDSTSAFAAAASEIADTNTSAISAITKTIGRADDALGSPFIPVVLAIVAAAAAALGCSTRARRYAR